jgi:predicted glycosyltransferase
MRIVFYCQHVWGVGHLFRTLEILKALDRHQVILVAGGAPVAVNLPPHVTPLVLPGLMMDRDYSALHAVEAGREVQAVIAERGAMLQELLRSAPCDLLVVELYPFGRNAFRAELDPLLDAIRVGRWGAVRVVCSLRDILVEKSDPVAYEERVLRCLNRRFDALMVHADPALVTLDATFRRTAEIAVPLVYTGFVTPRPAPDDRQRIRRALAIGAGDTLVVASAGGGKLGIRLLEPLLQGLAADDLAAGLHLRIFAGPYMEEGDFRRLQRFQRERCSVERFASDFIGWLAAADLSISMGGYNTSMNLLASGVPAIVWPTPQDREQRLRAEKLAALGAIRVLVDGDLSPVRLAAITRGLLAARLPRRPPPLNLDGAAATARWLERWMAVPLPAAAPAAASRTRP